MGNPVEAEAETALLATDSHDGAPPPYTPQAEEAAGPSSTNSGTGSDNSESSYADRVPMSRLGAPYRPFSPEMSVYYRLKFTRVSHLGDGAGHRLYAVSHYAGLSSKGPRRPCVVLRNGPGDRDAALAVAGEEKRWNAYSTTSAITLPAISNDAHDEGDNAGANTVTEIMQAGVLPSTNTVVFRFSIEVANGGREMFEWRKTNRKEAGEFKYCFRLVRKETSHDGELEVVAMARWKNIWSVNKPFNFQFVGKGLTGEFGERWAIMAVITGLRIWYLDLQGRASSSTITRAASR